MGESKRRRELQAQLVYHHTSTLRTNMLWMSGQILPEGKMPPAIHPQLGQVLTDATMRRAMKDFPPLVWFTREISVPRCLLEAAFYLAPKDGSEPVHIGDAEALSNAVALNRMALGFRIADIPVTPWPDHPGYATGEGRELNESAREAGDDPDQWFVADEPIDLLRMSEVRASRSVMKPKLERQDAYLSDVKRMVQMCRDDPGAFIPPAWLSLDEARALARRMGLPIR